MARRNPHPPELSCPARFALIFLGLWVMHLPWLRLPYFWDEAGYFVPAAHDLLLGGDLIPHTTLSNAHPPLVMCWLALCWKLTAYSPLVTRTAMLLVAAFGLTALWRIARQVASAPVANATVVLAALYPTIFCQSMMAQLDIAAFALILWTLDSHIRGRRWQAVAFAALAALGKETTVPVMLTLFGLDLIGWFANRWRPQLASRWLLPCQSLARCCAYLLALVPLVGWYAYHHHRTGRIFGNPGYLQYNVSATVTPARILVSLIMRIWHATGYLNLFVLTASALVLLWSARDLLTPGQLRGGPHLPSNGTYRDATLSASEANLTGIATPILLLFALVVLAQAAEFSVVGGALLARYMIPAVPLVILVAVSVLHLYAPRWKWWIAGCAVAFLAALFFNPPWFISPEDNLTWTRFVRMHQQAASYVERHYSDQRILTAWPASDELNRPFLGYVSKPLTVTSIENFTAEEVLRASRQPESFDVVVAFSTKFEPQRGLYRFIPGWTRLQTRYFDYHQDLAPQTIARMLHGRIVWRAATNGEWVAVIEVEKVRNARVQVSPFQAIKGRL